MEAPQAGSLPFGQEQPKQPTAQPAQAAPQQQSPSVPVAKTQDRVATDNIATTSRPVQTPPPSKQVVPDTRKMVAGLLNEKMNALQNFLGNKENALRFLSAVMKCIDTNPDLLKCKTTSLLGAFMEAAGLGFYPGNYSGDCYILPYGDVAQFQIGYRGLKTLSYRSGVARVGSEVVYENDEFKEELGTVQQLTHNRAQGNRGKAIGAYAWAEVTPGAIIFKYMTEDQIMKIKALSPARNSKYSPWNSNQDPEKWMWQKTAWKQLAKMVPTSDKMDRAVYLDNVSERGGYIEGEGVIVESEPLEQSQENKIDNVKEKKEAMRKEKVAPQSHE